MSVVFLPDLKASRDLRCAIRIETPYHTYMTTGVKDVNEEEEFVVIYTPETFEDTSTTTTLLLGDIVSVMLRPDVKYEM